MIMSMTTQQSTNPSQKQSGNLTNNTSELAGPLRQFLAMFYDAWLLAAVLMVASALTLPFTQSEPVKPGNPFMTTYIFFVWYGFYAWFWTHGGQTLGMRSWKIKITTDNAQQITLWHTLLRFISGLPAWALIGIGGYLMMADNPNLQHPILKALVNIPTGIVFAVGCILLLSGHLKNSWRDKFSSTNVVQIKKEKTNPS